MTTSNRLGITELAETQNNRSVTVNEAIAKLEAGATCFAALSIGDTAPPGSPAEGDLYVVGTSATGDWATHDGQVAVYYNAAWIFLPAIEGALAYAQDANAYYFYNGSAWTVFVGGSGGAGDVVGPPSATDGAFVQFDGTTGKLLKDGMAEATAAHIRANTADKVLTTDAVWSASAEVTLTDAATIAVDMSTFLNAVVTLGGNRTLGQPSNTKVGQSGVIRIVQDGTGSRTLAYHADWKFAGGTDPTLSTAAGATDLLFYQVIAANVIYANLVKAIA